jgi:CubicO group peptidase (beta-lactamase class C family)
MDLQSITKKVIVLFLIFFGEIFITLSERSMLSESQSDNTDKAISHRLSNKVSSYNHMAGAEEEIEQFIDRWNIVGASVAVTKNERLIYAKGFGYADREKREKVEPKHLFRVASISKLITAVAIMKLKEEGQLTLDDQVFGRGGILNQSKYQSIRDPRVRDITIYHLLTHSGGWDRYGGDPVFMPYTIRREMNVDLPVDLETTIKYTLSKRTLDFTPGSRSSYSNFGYAVLGKVIEKITGMDYESYVTSRILNPLGIYDMHLGDARPSNRLPNEVKYYSNSRYPITLSSFDFRKRVPRYYGGNNFQVLGAAGAWVASPAELMKFLAHIDGYPGKKDILSKESLEKMTRNNHGYNPIGWVSTTYNGIWKRSGTLAGTSALLKRCNNGFSWIMLVNTGNDLGHDFTYQIDDVMSQFIEDVNRWPQYDLFNYNTPKPLFAYTQSN